MGVICVQRGDDRGVHTVRIGKNIVVPKADDAITFSLNQSCPVVVSLRTVLPAVDLDDELRAMTCEVSDEMTDRHLPPEVYLRKG